MSTASSITSPSQSGLPIQEVIRSAEKELVQLLLERAEMMKRIGTIKQTLAGMAKLFGDSVLSPELTRLLGRGTPRPQPGFTRACRVVLMESGTPLEARQGCRELQRKFPDLFSRHKDPMASVTTVFNRLVGYSEARSFIGGNCRRVWEWVADSVSDNVSPAVPPLKGSVRSPEKLELVPSIGSRERSFREGGSRAGSFREGTTSVVPLAASQKRGL